ncbi:MAG TPA: hypothetical protein VGJ83_06240, partial [Gemmatimonadales bacterium]
MRVTRGPALVLAALGVVACDRAEPHQAAPPPQCQAPPPWPGPAPLHEPAGFRTLTDHEWSRITGDGWSYLRRTSSKNADICLDPSAPSAAAAVLRIIFTPDMQPNTDPGVHWVALPFAREVYAAWYVKLSPNWMSSPAGGGKITFLHTPGGQVYTGFFGSTAPHHLSVNTEWEPYGQKIWDPNVTTTPIGYGQWYRIEWYLRWESRPGASDGVIRWWVNGALNGDYRTIRFPFDGFSQFEFAPTLQNPPLNEQYM